MDRTAALLVTLGMAAVLFFATQPADASVQGDGSVPLDPNLTPDPSGGGAMPDATRSPLEAFLATIRQFESNGQYDVIFGGQHFTSFADHPRIKVWFHDPTRPGTGNNNWSDAAGAYQFISRTWDGLARRLGLSGFTPADQDAAAAQLLADLGVTTLLDAGNVAGAFARASGTWASLPGSLAQQHPQALETAMNTYNANLVA